MKKQLLAGSALVLALGSQSAAAQDVAERHGFLVACPTALAAPWRDATNEPLLEALLRCKRLLPFRAALPPPLLLPSCSSWSSSSSLSPWVDQPASDPAQKPHQ